MIMYILEAEVEVEELAVLEGRVGTYGTYPAPPLLFLAVAVAEEEADMAAKVDVVLMAEIIPASVRVGAMELDTEAEAEERLLEEFLERGIAGLS